MDGVERLRVEDYHYYGGGDFNYTFCANNEALSGYNASANPRRWSLRVRECAIVYCRTRHPHHTYVYQFLLDAICDDFPCDAASFVVYVRDEKEIIQRQKEQRHLRAN